MYTSLQIKLARIGKGDNLPLDMLRELVDANPRWQYYQKGVAYLLEPVFHQVVHWHFEKWSELGTDKDGKVLYHEAKTVLTFSNGAKGSMHVDESNFYRLDILGSRYRQLYFKLLKPGKLAYVAEQELYGLSSHELIHDGIMDHMSSGMTIPEGSPVMVVQTIMLDEVPLVKFLHGEQIAWTYGVLFEKEHFDHHDNDNHWI